MLLVSYAAEMLEHLKDHCKLDKRRVPATMYAVY
jgi:hypothetical protein